MSTLETASSIFDRIFKKKRSKKIILRHFQAPGDLICMTGVIRDLRAIYGSKYQIDVRSGFPEVFYHNPHLTPLENDEKDCLTIEAHHLVHESCNPINPKRFHLLTGFYHSVGKSLGIKIQPLIAKPDLHLSDEEKRQKPYPFHYWIICAGGKSDMTVKHWSRQRFIELSASLTKSGIRLVQIGDLAEGHLHATLPDAINLLGKTTLRDVFKLVYHSQGVIGQISMLTHVAAAFDKPSVVLAGGREDRFVFDYSPGLNNFGNSVREWNKAPQEVLSSIGKIPCAESRGCYKNLTTGDRKMPDICNNVAKITDNKHDTQSVSNCMDLITVAQAEAAVYRLMQNVPST